MAPFHGSVNPSYFLLLTRDTWQRTPTDGECVWGLYLAVKNVLQWRYLYTKVYLSTSAWHTSQRSSLIMNHSFIFNTSIFQRQEKEEESRENKTAKLPTSPVFIPQGEKRAEGRWTGNWRTALPPHPNGRNHPAISMYLLLWVRTASLMTSIKFNIHLSKLPLQVVPLLQWKAITRYCFCCTRLVYIADSNRVKCLSS